jgi:hypothetical protein
MRCAVRGQLGDTHSGGAVQAGMGVLIFQGDYSAAVAAQCRDSLQVAVGAAAGRGCRTTGTGWVLAVHDQATLRLQQPTSVEKSRPSALSLVIRM